MSSDYKDKPSFKSLGVLQSFRYALIGIGNAVKVERNLKIHFAVTIIVIFMGILCHLTWVEWIFLLFAIGGVISLELMNTALERLVDLVTSEYHPLAEQAKDISAGAVFVYTILSVIVGVIIFLPKII